MACCTSYRGELRRGVSGLEEITARCLCCSLAFCFWNGGAAKGEAGWGGGCGSCVPVFSTLSDKFFGLSPFLCARVAFTDADTTMKLSVDANSRSAAACICRMWRQNWKKNLT